MARTDNLAAEIWLQCFHHLDHCDLASLSSVCRHFQGLCQPLLFRDLGFRVQKRRDIAEHARLSTIRLEQLATSRHVACVRSWAFRLQKGGRHTPYPQVAQTYSAAINVFCSTLSTYHHLRSLTIHGLAIDDQLRQTLASLPRITDLSLWDSIVLARTGPLLALRSFHLSVSSFGSSQTTAPNQPLRLVSPETLLSLSIDGSSEANALLRTLTRQGTASQLSSLTITLSDVIVDTLFQFLEECPSLTEVAITRASVLTYALPHLPPSAASSLQTFTGPHSVAEAFTLGRPLTSITLLGVHDMHGGALSSSIQSLPPSLRTLSAEMHVGRIHEIAAIIAERFQELEELQLVLLAWDPDHVSVDTPPEQRMARLLPVVTVDDVDSSPFVEILPNLHPFALPPSLMTLRIKASWMPNSRSLAFPMHAQRRIMSGLHLSSASESLQHIVLGDEQGGAWVRQRWRELEGRAGVDVWRDMCTGEEVEIEAAKVG